MVMGWGERCRVGRDGMECQPNVGGGRKNM